jgi:hypothetical protein
MRVRRDCSPFVSGNHGGCIDALRRRCGFQPKSRRHFHRFYDVKQSRPSPINSYPYLPHDVHLELFTAAANQVYKANVQISGSSVELKSGLPGVAILDIDYRGRLTSRIEAV